MTYRSDLDARFCVRGCTVRDVHFSTCPSFGDAEGGTCRGCAPRAAADGMLICQSCYRSMRRLIDDAPDLLAHLRSIADPTKARAYDAVSVSSSRPELPAPVAADLLDASNDVAVTLRMWEDRILHPDVDDRRYHLAAGIQGDVAADQARWCADVMLAGLDAIANDKRQAIALGRAVLERSMTSSPDFWTIADVAAKWSLEDRMRWAEAACPQCDMKAVRVLPPRSRVGITRYICRECEWEANDQDDDGLWAAVFSSAEAVPLGDGMPHDPRWLTLAAAARLARVTTATVRRWADREKVKTDAGRYWQPDVEAVIEERKAGAA